MSDFSSENNIFSYQISEETVPLDVLLDLCKKGKVDIKDIFLSDITEQYLDYIASLETKDYDDISDFILLASTLLEYKSLALLPKIIDEQDQIEAPSEAMFLLKLEEYRMLKEAGEKLGESEILNRFYRDPVFGEDEYKLVIKNFSLEKMITAFALLLERIEFPEVVEIPKTVDKEPITVAERFTQIIEELRAYRSISFFGLFSRGRSKLMVINTFLAMLEILKRQIAIAEQAEFNGDIILTYQAGNDVLTNENQEELLQDVDGYN
ncbi:MAG: segregation/condensation protein A [Clostridia bacterium]